jgi:hypothetical protein
MISATSYSTTIWSDIAGYYATYPLIPYGHANSYTEHNLEKF